MSCTRALNFDQWKTFSKNYKPMRVWLWLVYKFTESYCCLWLFSEFVQTQNRYPTSLDKIGIVTSKNNCHINLRFFLWTKLLESLLLAKYLISVTATLMLPDHNLQKNFCLYAHFTHVTNLKAINCFTLTSLWDKFSC